MKREFTVRAYLKKRNTIYKGKVVDISVDTVVFPTHVAEMECLQHAGGAAIVPVLPYNSVVVIQQYRHCVGDTIWEIPAGRLEPGENPLECAKRELEEEVGYKAARVKKLTEIYSAPAYCTEIIAIYLATGLTPGVQRLDDDEIIKMVKLPLKEAVEKVKAGEIRDAKTAVGLLLAYRL